MTALYEMTIAYVRVSNKLTDRIICETLSEEFALATCVGPHLIASL